MYYNILAINLHTSYLNFETDYVQWIYETVNFDTFRQIYFTLRVSVCCHWENYNTSYFKEFFCPLCILHQLLIFYLHRCSKNKHFHFLCVIKIKIFLLPNVHKFVAHVTDNVSLSSFWITNYNRKYYVRFAFYFMASIEKQNMLCIIWLIKTQINK